MEDPDLKGRCILLVEDDHMVAKSLARLLELWGAKIVGPTSTVDRAFALLRSTRKIDFGLLDITLRGRTVFPVADALMARGVPFAFTTGSSTSIIPERYRDVPVLQKPMMTTKSRKPCFRQRLAQRLAWPPIVDGCPAPPSPARHGWPRSL